MNNRKLFCLLAMTALFASAAQAEKKSAAKADRQKGIIVTFDAEKAKIENNLRDSAQVEVNGTRVSITSEYQKPINVTLQGRSEDGSVVLKSAGKVRLELNGLQLTSKEGAPLWLKNKKRVEIVAVDGTESSLTIEACQDTATYKASVIHAKDKLFLSGKGTLNLLATGDGCKGINAKKDVTIDDLTLNVTTTGSYLSRDENGGFPGFGGGFPGGGFPGLGGEGGPEGGFPGFPGGGFPDFGGGGFPGGGFPGFGEGGFPDFGGGGFPSGGFPGFGEGGFPEGGFPGGGFPGFGGGDDDEEGGFGGFPFGGSGLVGTTKAIKSKGVLTINSGKVTAKASADGGEGLEGKKGVVINGGEVNVLTEDDAINSQGPIVFNGGRVFARSTGNDAVDSNSSKKGAITITGGEVYAWSHVGVPEEGLDCDFASIVITGGRVFSIGGGMGDMPSTPSEETAEQTTALLIGLALEEGKEVAIYEGTEEKLGKKIDSFVAPFTLGRSSSLITYPELKADGHYVVKSGDKTYPLELTGAFTVVRDGNSEGGGWGGFGGFGGGFPGGGFGGGHRPDGPREGFGGGGPRGNRPEGFGGPRGNRPEGRPDGNRPPREQRQF